jgi:aquaporin Z
MQNNARIFGAEALGTAVLVAGGVGTAVLAPGIGQLGVALAFGFSVLAMVYVIGPVSGGHMNPAITLGMRLARKIDTARAVVAWAGQLLGGAIGALVIWGIANGQDDWSSGSFGSNGWAQLSPGAYGLGSVIVAEVVFTAVLVLVALASTGARFAAGLNGVAVGVTLALIHMISIQIDNTSVNPARSLGAAIFAEIDSDALPQLWVFIVFPLVGAIVGVFLWLMIDDARLESTELFVPGIAQARDIADRAIDEVVEEVEETFDGPDEPKH